jgi:hypothetical protein
VAAKIFPAAKKKLKVAVPGTGLPDDLRSRMNRSGIDFSVLLSLAKGRDDVSSLNQWVLSICGDGLVAFGAVHPFMDNLEEELDRLKGLGIKGVKMMPLLQEVYPDDPRCGRLYEALVERNMILVTHAGRDPLDREEVFGTPERFARAIDSYPDMRLVLAHLGGLGMYDEVRRHLLDAGRNVYFDTAYVSFYLKENDMATLIKDIGSKRILFGSDYPWEDPGRAADIVKSLDLSEGEKEDILSKTACKLLEIAAP